MVALLIVVLGVDGESLTQDLPGLLPTTAASALLIVLLRIWVLERRSWSLERATLMTERENLIKAHQEEVESKHQLRLQERAVLLKEREDAVRVAVSDHETLIRFLRERVTECEAELETLRRRRAAGDGPGA